ncbi:hypothetical protein PPTG_11671 [Phytophthora nicotianae INRA-310]|uniref:Uncharacterized protein n=1 Tax=Phytophthora nicotianae (strain INRA-310) TaxID=761204 RepID=W2Q8I9_PHYN3|nr:hypothetical protein PPTG_11671 [Phytophthora nicotianae INRA-310]ETN08859.1 hypothetical protein PPTG_11671 [Phytophthora nicotianae INRA-310]
MLRSSCLTQRCSVDCTTLILATQRNSSTLRLDALLRQQKPSLKS